MNMYKSSIESIRKYTICPTSAVELRLSVDGRIVYNICQEYPAGYQSAIAVPTSEELEIEIKVVRRIVK